MKTFGILAALALAAVAYFVATAPAEVSLKDRADQYRNAVSEAESLWK